MMKLAVGTERADGRGVDKSGGRVRWMFASIAGRYDLLNHLLSLNIDRHWRRFTTRTVPPSRGSRCSTAARARPTWPWPMTARGGGSRPSSGPTSADEMLCVGAAKVRKAGAAGRVVLVEGDTQRLPLPGDTFGVVTVAFGLRNVADTARGIDEMIRVARPGGQGRDPRILQAARGDPRRGCIWPSSATSCPGSARRSPPTTTTPTATCRPACSSSRTARRCSTSWAGAA